MATRGKKPGKDIADLKARLGLNKSLSQKKEAPPAPAPAPPQVAAPPQAAPVAAGPPPQARSAGPPPQARPAGPQPGGRPAPPFAQAPRPPQRPAPAPAKKVEADDWKPPAIDTSAGLDVPIVEHKGPFQKYGPFGVAVVAGLVFGIIGYLMGGANEQRSLYNGTSRDASRILNVVKPKVDQLRNFKALVDKHQPSKPDADLIKALQKADYLVDPSTLGTQHMLLGPVVTADLMTFTSDTKLLFNTIRMHTFMTNNADKKELEEIIKASESIKADGFAILFDSKGFAKAYDSKEPFESFKGKLVVFDNQKPFEKKGEQFVKVRYPTNNQELEVPVRSLLIVSKEELLKSSGTNALKRYQIRHKQLKVLLDRMSQYMDKLVSGLEKLSVRGDAPVINSEEPAPADE